MVMLEVVASKLSWSIVLFNALRYISSNHSAEHFNASTFNDILNYSSVCSSLISRIFNALWSLNFFLESNSHLQTKSWWLLIPTVQLRAAAHAVGEADLEKKFEAASESLRRGIMFANSLYLWWGNWLTFGLNPANLALLRVLQYLSLSMHIVELRCWPCVSQSH